MNKKIFVVVRADLCPDRDALPPNRLAVIGYGLIDLIDPVAEQKMGMAAPAILGGKGNIISGEIAMRRLDRFPGGHIAIILFFERRGVIFDMIEAIEAPGLRI